MSLKHDRRAHDGVVVTPARAAQRLQPADSAFWTVTMKIFSKTHRSMWCSVRRVGSHVAGAGAAVRTASTQSMHLSAASFGAASSALRPAVFGAAMQRRDVLGLFSRRKQLRLFAASSSGGDDENDAEELSADDAEELSDLGAEVEAAEADIAVQKRPVLWRGRPSDAVGALRRCGCCARVSQLISVQSSTPHAIELGNTSFPIKNGKKAQ